MSAIITSKFRIQDANLLIDEIKRGIRAYFALGRVQAWPDDTAPTSPKDTVSEEINDWNELFGAKRVTENDVTPAVIRFNWVSGTTYTVYDSAAEQISLNQNFYVLTLPDTPSEDAYHVYKCLRNGAQTAPNYEAQPSVVKPTSTSAAPFTTSDGYLWKYLYTLTQNEVAKFLTPDTMPVHEVASNSATSGAIWTCVVDNGGSGYSSGATAAIVGDGSGATATVNVVGGVVKSITMSAVGSNYRNATVTITPVGAGSGATAHAVISPDGGHGTNNQEELGGFLTSINVRIAGVDSPAAFPAFSVANDFRKIVILKNPLVRAGDQLAHGGRVSGVEINTTGSGYGSPPTVTIYDGPGDFETNAPTATATQVGGVVTTVTVTNGSSNLGFTPVVSFTGGGTPTRPAQAKAHVVGGVIEFIEVIDGGAGYSGAPTVNIGGYGATGTAVLGTGPDSGKVVSVTTTAVGQNYYQPTVKFTGGGGTGATGTVVTYDSYRMTRRFTLASVTNAPFQVDAVVQDTTTGATAVVVEHDLVNSYLYVRSSQYGATGDFAAPHIIQQVGTPSKSAQITAIQESELKDYTGEVFYVEHRTPSTRSANETESITVVLEH